MSVAGKQHQHQQQLSRHLSLISIELFTGTLTQRDSFLRIPTAAKRKSQLERDAERPELVARHLGRLLRHLGMDQHQRGLGRAATPGSGQKAHF